MTNSQLNKQLVDAVMAKHYQHDWQSHALQVVRGMHVTWTDRNGASHRVDGFDKADLLKRIQSL